jgi:hypothetical protein
MCRVWNRLCPHSPYCDHFTEPMDHFVPLYSLAEELGRGDVAGVQVLSGAARRGGAVLFQSLPNGWPAVRDAGVATLQRHIRSTPIRSCNGDPASRRVGAPCCTYVAGACGTGWARTGRHGTRWDNDSKSFREVARQGRDSAEGFAPPGAGSIPAASLPRSPANSPGCWVFLCPRFLHVPQCFPLASLAQSGARLRDGTIHFLER